MMEKTMNVAHPENELLEKKNNNKNLHHLYIVQAQSH